MRRDLSEGLRELVGRVRDATELPVVAGFGISRPEHMKSLRGVVDAAAVGSAIVDAIDKGGDGVELVKNLLTACR
jgi:tryptophan synthase alpha chain